MGKPIRDKILAEVDDYIKNLNPSTPIGKIKSISIGDNAEVGVYIRNQKKVAESVSIPFEDEYWPSTITQQEAKSRILAMNDDMNITGIILQRPVPEHIHVRSLQSAIHPLKDIEGMNPASIGNIVYSDVALAPCTAAASVELIKATGLDLKGLEVVMIGHSEIVGKPASMLLMAEGSTVTVCHHMTRSVAMHSRRADVVVVAVGKAHLIGADMIKPGAAVIDIGINQTSDESGNPTIVGDVDTDAVKEVASWVTPVPGGVGPVTVAILMRNTIAAHRRQIKQGWVFN